MRILSGILEDLHLRSSRILLNLAEILKDPAKILGDPEEIPKVLAKINKDSFAGS